MVLTEQTDIDVGDVIHRDNTMMDDKMKESQIQKLFAGSTVFVTGGTGFLGKLLVEKLLRSCPDIKKLYLLTRPKKNKDISQRLQEQFDNQLYDKLRKEKPDFIEKIGIIEGDVGQNDLGISKEDRAKITKEVEFIFHAAATVRFNESLKKAVEINVRGTRYMLLLARACTKLRAYVHISTAYSNCPLKEIDEKFYESPLTGDELINLVEKFDEKTLNSITTGLLGDFPNTYVYSKSAGEDIVQKYSQGLPVTVFRPSIMISIAKEPLQGWIDNVYGPTGVTVGVGVGLIRVWYCYPKAIADLVPCDMVVNGCIAAAWKTAKEYTQNHEKAPIERLPYIYNYISSEQAPLSWENFMKYTAVNGMQVPSMLTMWPYMLWLTPYKFLYNFYCFFLHWIPAYIVDAVLVIIGKKPMLIKAYTKIATFSAVIDYFAVREWKFHNTGTRNLYNELCETDKKLFDFDMGSVEWQEYFKAYIIGLRVHILKDPLDTIPQGKRRYIKLKILHYFCIGLICSGLVALLIALLRLVVRYYEDS